MAFIAMMGWDKFHELWDKVRYKNIIHLLLGYVLIVTHVDVIANVFNRPLVKKHAPYNISIRSVLYVP